MSDLSSRLNLPFIKPSQAQKHVTHNEALLVLDGLVQSVLEATGAETPPVDPVDGTLFALGANPTGDWDGQGGNMALRREGAWHFIAPQTGWRAWDKAAAAFVIFASGSWAPIAPDHDNLPGVGVGTTSDATNKLAVASDASLFSHDGTGHQLKVNKAAGGDTASLLFQSNWTGHAEMGLAGDTAFSVKISDDGTAWSTAMRADPAAGEVAFDLPITGTAVQQSAADATPGRLMRADWGYGPGTVLGTVGLSAGVPTGGLIEQGSNTDGEYVRFADGTQICWINDFQMDFYNFNLCTGTWTFPAEFAANPVVATGNPNHLNATPTEFEMLPPRASGVTPVVAPLRTPRVAGSAGFVTGDFVTTDVLAIGRWA